MTAYYNEIDPFAAEWLRQLIKHGHIAQGEVDERDIRDVLPSDLRGFDQCHFFAGIGGWSYALRLAGWPDDKPVWSGSTPCQPFSQAGKGKGTADERHLWPAFHHLIKECRPDTIFGEQVGSKAGRAWLDTLHDDLEGEKYAVGAAVIPACGIGSPHIRQRLWFVAERLAYAERDGQHRSRDPRQGRRDESSDGCRDSGPGPTNGFWRDVDWLYCRDGKWRQVIPTHVSLLDGIPHTMGRGIPEVNREAEIDGQKSKADTDQALQGVRIDHEEEAKKGTDGRSSSFQEKGVLRQRMHGQGNGEGATYTCKHIQREGEQKVSTEFVPEMRSKQQATSRASLGQGPFKQYSVELDDIVRLLPSSLSLAKLDGRWRDFDGLSFLHKTICQVSLMPHPPEQTPEVWASLSEEEKNRVSMDIDVRAWRKLVFNPLSSGESGRTGRLRGYGNAIVPQVAAQFIEAYIT